MGIYDPVGNIWQFTEDFLRPAHYLKQVNMKRKIRNQSKTKGPRGGNKKITRGGFLVVLEKHANRYGLYF